MEKKEVKKMGTWQIILLVIVLIIIGFCVYMFRRFS
jgi:uncharacterized protein YpmB